MPGMSYVVLVNLSKTWVPFSKSTAQQTSVRSTNYTMEMGQEHKATRDESYCEETATPKAS
jgi:hypothetical protein